MIIESGLVKAGLVKAGLVQAISNINSRYFRRNEGTTDYATIPEVTLAGDFEIEFDLMIAAGNNSVIFGNSLTANNFFVVFADGKVRIRDDAANTIDSAIGAYTFGRFNNVRIVKSGADVSCLLDGAEVFTGTSSGQLIIDLLYKYFSGLNAQGILANLKIYDNGTLIRDYPLDDNSDTLRDRANGQIGTVINGNASDWGLFQKQATREWLGQELATISSTPPLGDDSDPEFITVTSGIILDKSFRIGANFSNSGFAAAGCGWSTSRGVPTAPPFRSTSWVSGDFIGGDFTAVSSGIQQLFGRGGSGVASYDNVSVKEVLNVA